MTRTKRPKPVHQMTIAQFAATFPNEEACRSYLVARRWPATPRSTRWRPAIIGSAKLAK
jgi:hypothetical protein